MNPCKACIKKYEVTPCTKLGHCAFEGTNIDLKEEFVEPSLIETNTIANRHL